VICGVFIVDAWRPPFCKAGGAIAPGHPLDAAGARIVGRLARGPAAAGPAGFGVAALCVGGGMGMAMLQERGG
jgi:acetyl-CoA C-acetyltransferase